MRHLRLKARADVIKENKKIWWRLPSWWRLMWYVGARIICQRWHQVIYQPPPFTLSQGAQLFKAQCLCIQWLIIWSGGCSNDTLKLMAGLTIKYHSRHGSLSFSQSYKSSVNHLARARGGFLINTSWRHILYSDLCGVFVHLSACDGDARGIDLWTANWRWLTEAGWWCHRQVASWFWYHHFTKKHCFCLWTCHFSNQPIPSIMSSSKVPVVYEATMTS